MNRESESEATKFSQRPLRFREDWKDIGDRFDGVFTYAPGKDYLRFVDAHMSAKRAGTAACGTKVADYEEAFRSGEKEFYEWLATEEETMKMMWQAAFCDGGPLPPHARRTMALLHRYTR
tara:strand:- start:204 stop:563 length:360 start_codon:yes stop_codon:yes gene_type:complete